eukprot:CAMPEP_0113305716 /NCGR_PEP_ID=MMETSP0010_2-20120614/5241_1 /TAXON_ID=216773 ORGANISM="Corethron hystrix, Strain 308" /NCGR_SAMPLE_ID=MMETSP0010_2 /ASSEMBLY_ACC=CAM_ASM_000155 /LENGTH=1244 /DNA_ID=CAMNT_0000160209 /DNA_START=1 /DNA_END=3732 /DNA_ORIENTATION=- /assembly_acc=CAM_ASM_000155
MNRSSSALDTNKKDISVDEKEMMDQMKNVPLDTETAPLGTITEDEILVEEERLAVKGIEKVGLTTEGEEKGLHGKNGVTEEQMEEAQLGLEANEKRVDDNEKVGKEHEENKIIDEELEKVKLSNKVQDVQFSHYHLLEEETGKSAEYVAADEESLNENQRLVRGEINKSISAPDTNREYMKVWKKELMDQIKNSSLDTETAPLDTTTEDEILVEEEMLAVKGIEKVGLAAEGEEDGLHEKNGVNEEQMEEAQLGLKVNEKIVDDNEKLGKEHEGNKIIDEQLEKVKLSNKVQDVQFSHDHLSEEETGKSAEYVAADEDSLNENQKPARGEIYKYGSALDTNGENIKVWKKKLIDQIKNASLDAKTAPLDRTTENKILAEEEMLAVKGIEKVGLTTEGEEDGLHEKNGVTEEQMEEAQLGLEANEKKVDDNEKLGKEHEENKILSEHLENVKLSAKAEDWQFHYCCWFEEETGKSAEYVAADEESLNENQRLARGEIHKSISALEVNRENICVGEKNLMDQIKNAPLDTKITQLDTTIEVEILAKEERLALKAIEKVGLATEGEEDGLHEKNEVTKEHMEEAQLGLEVNEKIVDDNEKVGKEHEENKIVDEQLEKVKLSAKAEDGQFSHDNLFEEETGKSTAHAAADEDSLNENQRLVRGEINKSSLALGTNRKDISVEEKEIMDQTKNVPLDTETAPLDTTTEDEILAEEERLAVKGIEEVGLSAEGGKENLHEKNGVTEEQMEEAQLGLEVNEKIVDDNEKLGKEHEENKIVDEQLEKVKLSAKVENKHFSHDHSLEEETGKSAAQVAADEESLNENQRLARGEICIFSSVLEANRENIRVGKENLIDQIKKTPLDTTSEDEILAEEEGLAVKVIEKVGLAAESEEKGLRGKNEVTEEQMEEAQLGLEVNERRVDDNEKLAKEESSLILAKEEKISVEKKISRDEIKDASLYPTIGDEMVPWEKSLAANGMEKVCLSAEGEEKLVHGQNRVTEEDVEEAQVSLEKNDKRLIDSEKLGAEQFFYHGVMDKSKNLVKEDLVGTSIAAEKNTGVNTHVNDIYNINCDKTDDVPVVTRFDGLELNLCEKGAKGSYRGTKTKGDKFENAKYLSPLGPSVKDRAAYFSQLSPGVFSPQSIVFTKELSEVKGFVTPPRASTSGSYRPGTKNASYEKHKPALESLGRLGMDGFQDAKYWQPNRSWTGGGPIIVPKKLPCKKLLQSTATQHILADGRDTSCDENANAAETLW